MRNQKRPVFIVCATAAVLLVAVVALAQTVLIRSFERIEADLVRDSVGRMRKALEADLRQLDVVNRGYAHWDETYRFMRGLNPAFIDSTLRKESLDSQQIDLVWIVDANGQSVYSSERRDEKSDMISPASLLDELRKQIGDLEQVVNQDPLNRLARLHGELAAISVQRILRTDRNGPPLGFIVLARFLQPDELSRLSNTSQLTTTLIDLHSNAARFMLPKQVRTLLASDPPPREVDFWTARDDENLSGYTVLLDIHGTPVAALATNLRRDVMMLGNRTTLGLIGILAAFILIFVTMVLVFISRLDHTGRARRRAERKLQANRRKLTKLSHHDTLTGLPNRHFLQLRLPRLLERAMRSQKLLALLYLDIDHFKNINDCNSHGIGDALLRLVADRLSHTVYERDLVVRMGGDEFVIVATGLADRAAVEAMAQRLMGVIGTPIEREGTHFMLTVSMGVSVYPDDGLDLEVLLKHADIALYQAKDRGRNNYQLYSADMNARLMETVALERALRRAISMQELYLEYQPIVDVPSGAIVAVEALLRWQHPELGAVPPSRFIPIAENCGTICDIGDFVLREACRQLNEWLLDGVPIVPVCINVSPRQFERGRMQETVERVTREFGIDPCLLTFEITEGAVMHDIDQHLGTLHELRRLGSRIAVDDFGTGYSSLSYLKHLPIDALKIDRAFVRDMATDSNDAAIVTAIVNMARSLGLRTVAEGVETEDQLVRLRSLGCDAAQGFHLDRPMAARACRARLEQSAAKVTRGETMRRKALRIIRGSA